MENYIGVLYHIRVILTLAPLKNRTKQNFICVFQNQEMQTEGDIVTSINQSDKVRELQDKIASLRAQVSNNNSRFR